MTLAETSRRAAAQSCREGRSLPAFPTYHQQRKEIRSNSPEGGVL
jgi:hypothetical protein